jgi:hypothetical protein
VTANPAPDAQAGTVAAVLAAHTYTYPDTFCECGAYAGSRPWVDYPAHLAAALAAAGLTTEADQPRDGLRAAVEALAVKYHNVAVGDPVGGGWFMASVVSAAHVADDLDSALLADQPPTPDEGGARE